MSNTHPKKKETMLTDTNDQNSANSANTSPSSLLQTISHSHPRSSSIEEGQGKKVRVGTFPIEERTDCTIAYVRSLTAPPIVPPKLVDVKQELLAPWSLRIPIDPSDELWGHVHHNGSKLCYELFDWDPNNHQVVKLCSYVNISMNPYSSFSNPLWREIAVSLQRILFRRVGSRQKGSYVALTSFGQHIFLATGPGYIEREIWNMHLNRTYYLLRCHYDASSCKLIFGYHHIGSEGKDLRKVFHPLIELSLHDDDWRLKVMKLLINAARIINCLIDYAIPLTCQPSKRCILDDTVQKAYARENICGIRNATIASMIHAYRELDAHKVPHTDHLLSVQGNEVGGYTCTFGPIGRSYPPLNIHELLDALLCVAQVLASIHELGLMHRDIRWANVFRAFVEDDDHSTTFSNEWVLFDFEFAATSPQPSFGKYTLTTANHAPEMFLAQAEEHGTAADIWALGFLVDTANVDFPKSHQGDLDIFKRDCMQDDPHKRPTADQCLQVLQMLKLRPCSHEKDVMY